MLHFVLCSVAAAGNDELASSLAPLYAAYGHAMLQQHISQSSALGELKAPSDNNNNSNAVPDDTKTASSNDTKDSSDSNDNKGEAATNDDDNNGGHGDGDGEEEESEEKGKDKDKDEPELLELAYETLELARRCYEKAIDNKSNDNDTLKSLELALATVRARIGEVHQENGRYHSIA
jgi:cobalamin biosynthesis protein CobT